MANALRLIGVVALICVWAGPAGAEWPHDPQENLPVCTASGDQTDPRLVSDDEGGAVIAWCDGRTGGSELYAQRVDSWGGFQWTEGGVPVSTVSNAQYQPRIASDGASGAIITWANFVGYFDVYAQRIGASGGPHWTTDGVPICVGAFDAWFPDVVADGAGGACIVWQDRRTMGNDIYAQRVDASGDTMWPANGVLVCADASDQAKPRVISDGCQGAIVTWEDYRSGGYRDIYAQRVDASGDTLWRPGGVPVCTATDEQYMPRIVPDASGGAIIVWHDHRSGFCDVYAQRLAATGDTLWAADGEAVCTADGHQLYLDVLSDGAGGAFVAWSDERDGVFQDDIYVQRLDASGARLWSIDGEAVCTAFGEQLEPQLAPDGLGGVIVTWYDWRSVGSADVYAQHVDASGSMLWATDGLPVGAAAGDQRWVDLVSDGAGGAIMAWRDARSGVDTEEDIYAQRVERNGYLGYPSPTITDAVDHPDDQGDQIIVSWSPSYLDEWPLDTVDLYTIWHRYGGTGSRHGASPVLPGLRDLEALGRRGWIYVDQVEAMQFDEYGYVAPSFGDSTESGIIWTDFMVLAHSTGMDEYWLSEPLAGYSVDNLAPGAPLGLLASAIEIDVKLVWSPSRFQDEDLDHYNVHRSATQGFAPDPATLIGTAQDTVFTDVEPGPGTWYYLVLGEDVHGNESGPSNEASATPWTGIEEPYHPTEFALVGNRPNPLSGRTRIVFDLPEARAVTLRVYSAHGRLVATLEDGRMPSGRHSARWDGRDDHGRELPSGVYFARLEAGEDRAVHKMVLLR